MDAFFASVEQRDEPSLRGKPVVVGGPSRRGVVCAASYEARPFGVRSAMPMGEALRRCPQAIVVPPRHGRYAEVSEDVFAIFRRYTPLVEGLSFDEAFLDVTASRSLFGEGEVVARRIKDEIRAELGLTASAGVAPNKFAAKIASDLEKPDGLVVVPDDVAGFLAPLAIERMWGVGPKAAARLRGDGFTTIGDLARAGPGRLEALLGAWGADVAALAQGLDDRAVVPSREAASIGAEETFERDVTSREELSVHLLAETERVAQRLVRAGLLAGVVTVKLKHADFTLRTRQMKLREPACDTTTLFEAVTTLLARFEMPRRGVRLTGVSASGLVPEGASPSLFPDPVAEKRRSLEALVSAASDKFGAAGLTRASLLGREGRR